MIDLYELSSAEKTKLRYFLSAAEPLLKRGATWALVFHGGSGIGIGVSATVKLGDETLEEDITDYGKW